MYKTDIYKQPFWAENSGFITGRDPLGIQNSSVSVYARLLPGMTNQTLRLRYYGFYCWLLNEYDKLPLEKEHKNLEHHYNFIRKAELIIAFIMETLESNQTSIVGSDYTGNHKEEIKELGYYNIDKGAIKKNENDTVYWKYPSGALGQYYLGSLINMELLGAENRFFFIKDRGHELADCFEKSISLYAQQLFLETIHKGKLSEENISDLEEFGINRMEVESDEWLFYKNMLLEVDGDQFKTSDGKISTKRKDTLMLFLQYLKTDSPTPSFQSEQYRKIDSDTQLNEANFGWYYYFVNEALHYCVETIFWGMLVELDGRVISLVDYIDSISKILLDEIGKKNDLNKEDTLIEALTLTETNDLIEELNSLVQLTKSPQQSHEAAGSALNLIFQIYLDIEKKLNKISEFENQNLIIGQKGIISEHIETYVTNFFETKLDDYLKQVVKIIINDHISTAYRKMGNGEANLLKFVIEDGNIGHIQTMPPKFTNPRLRTLNNFLVDLHFVDENNELTDLGNELLTQID